MFLNCKVLLLAWLGSLVCVLAISDLTHMLCKGWPWCVSHLLAGFFTWCLRLFHVVAAVVFPSSCLHHFANILLAKVWSPPFQVEEETVPLDGRVGICGCRWNPPLPLLVQKGQRHRNGSQKTFANGQIWWKTGSPLGCEKWESSLSYSLILPPSPPS